MMGLPELRQAVSVHYRHWQALDLDPEAEVMITSGATEAEIHLRLGDHPSLEVRDSGMGFDPERAGAGLGMGLAGMRERAAEIEWTV